jgi:uncharacterized protein with HEPN domain
MSSDQNKWKFRLRHMREAIEKVLRYAAGMDEEQFHAAQQTVEAVVWNLTVLGEAARHIPQEIVDAHPEIPWPQMRGIRNRVIHGYDQINWKIIWNVVKLELPPLVPLLEQIDQDTTD